MVTRLFVSHFQEKAESLLALRKKFKKEPSLKQSDRLLSYIDFIHEHLIVAERITADQYNFTKKLKEEFKAKKHLHLLILLEQEKNYCSQIISEEITLKRVKKQQKEVANALFKKVNKQLSAHTTDDWKGMGKQLKKGLKYFDDAAFAQQITFYIYEQFQEMRYWKQYFSSPQAPEKYLELILKVEHWFGFLLEAYPEHPRLLAGQTHFAQLKEKLQTWQTGKQGEGIVLGMEEQLKKKEKELFTPQIEAEGIMQHQRANQSQVEAYRLILHQKGMAPHRWKLS